MKFILKFQLYFYLLIISQCELVVFIMNFRKGFLHLENRIIKKLYCISLGNWKLLLIRSEFIFNLWLLLLKPNLYKNILSIVTIDFLQFKRFFCFWIFLERILIFVLFFYFSLIHSLLQIKFWFWNKWFFNF